MSDDNEKEVEAMVLVTATSGRLTIRKDAVIRVECTDWGGRNCGCAVNGIPTTAGYDFVLSALGWKLEEVT